MKALIEDLLTLERVDSERKSAWVEFDLGELVMDVVEAQRSTADLKRHALTLKVNEGETNVVGNMTQLRQAMTNLIGNGIKYTPNQGYIQVRLKQEDKRVIFEVEDNGYGISEEKQGRLFQRFYRALEPGTDHIAGTGLGLSLVKTVIENHGGEVWVKSEVGVGSTFGFWLPRADSAHEKLEQDAAS
jgi:two-component system phosphate regulon sensor histidine kinase PhoR